MAPTPARLVTQPGTGPTPKFKHNASLATQTATGLIWTSTKLENTEIIWCSWWKFLSTNKQPSVQTDKYCIISFLSILNRQLVRPVYHTIASTNNCILHLDSTPESSRAEVTAIVPQEVILVPCPLNFQFANEPQLKFSLLHPDKQQLSSGAIDCETNQMQKNQVTYVRLAATLLWSPCQSLRDRNVPRNLRWGREPVPNILEKRGMKLWEDQFKPMRSVCFYVSMHFLNFLHTFCWFQLKKWYEYTHNFMEQISPTNIWWSYGVQAKSCRRIRFLKTAPESKYKYIKILQWLPPICSTYLDMMQQKSEAFDRPRSGQATGQVGECDKHILSTADRYRLNVIKFS